MDKLKTVFMFSGQGSQYYQMGLHLFEHNQTFRQCMLAMDTQVRDLAGYSVIDALYDPGQSKAGIFDRLRLSHPAIFMVEYALAQALINAGVEPDMTLGASLGSYAAATIAGSVKMEDALSTIVNQARLIEAQCDKGGMIAILADPQIYQQDVLRQNSVVASVNFANHFVVAARADKLVEIEDFLRAKQVTFQRLAVLFAFHSQWIESAKSAVQESVQGLQLKAASMPIACCVHGGTIGHIPDGYFWRVVREPIRFQETLAHLEAKEPCRYIDVGPGGTLATFLKYSLTPSSRSKATTILSPYGRELQNFTAAVAALVA